MSDYGGDGDTVLWLRVCSSFAVLAAVALSYKFIEPNGGRIRKAHALYWAFALCAVFLLHENVARYIFTNLTVTLVGAVYPVYRATKAACTPYEEDDKEWLQYWMLGGVLFMATTWVDEVIQEGGGAVLVWRGWLLFSFFWLYFPLTCGALLIYEHVTQPVLGPCLQPMQQKMSGYIVGAYQTLANASHLYVLWIFFVILPSGSKRAIAVLIGTVYPCISSVAATATEEIDDDTYWLTYWAAYGTLFLLMDLLETWLGEVPGFYSVIVWTTAYLMLPMFRGAEKVFRKVLVPLAGLREMLVLRDAIQVKKMMLKDLPPERAMLVQQHVANIFAVDAGNADPAALNRELKQSWNHLVPKKLFGKPKYETPSPVNPMYAESSDGRSLV